MIPSNKSRNLTMLFWVIIWFIITIIIGTIQQNNKTFSIFYFYNKVANIDKQYINQYDIESWKQSPNSDGIKAVNEQIIRLEFSYDTIKNKMLSLSLKWSGSIQWYMVSKKPILNCNSWAINEWGSCRNSYFLFRSLKNIYWILEGSRLVRQSIAIIDDKQLSSLKDKKVLSIIDRELGNYHEYTIPYFIFSYMKKYTNMERNVPSMNSPRWYSIIYLKTNERNNITFNPYDLLSDIDNVWYIISLSWGSSIEYKLIENPLSMIDSEWLNN